MKISKKISSMLLVGSLLISCMIPGGTALAASAATISNTNAYIINSDTGEQLPVQVTQVPMNAALYSDGNSFSQTYEYSVILPVKETNPGITPFTSTSVTDSDKTNSVTVTLTNNYTISGDILTYKSVSGTVRKGTAVAITSGELTYGQEYNNSVIQYPGGSPSFYYSTGFKPSRFAPGVFAGANYDCTIRNSSGSWRFKITNNITM